MPSYCFLFDKEADVKALPSKIAVQAKLGVPWPIMNDGEINDMVVKQAKEITESIVNAGVYLPNHPELKGTALHNYLVKSQGVALIAYIQKLGAYKEVKKEHPVPPSSLNPDSHRETAAPQSPDNKL